MNKSIDKQLNQFAKDLSELSPQKQGTLFVLALNRTGRRGKT